jgi:hypothetical protein
VVIDGNVNIFSSNSLGKSLSIFLKKNPYLFFFIDSTIKFISFSDEKRYGLVVDDILDQSIIVLFSFITYFNKS